MLTPADFAELESHAAQLNTKNHLRFVSEVLACLRQSGDPVAAYELLARMHLSAHAARENEQFALRDVCAWLNATLIQLPRRPLADIELRIAWTRKIVRIAVEQSRNRRYEEASSRASGKATGYRPPPIDTTLRMLRQKYPKPPPPSAHPLPPRFRPAKSSPSSDSKSASIVQQAPLPHALEVMFASHRDAVTALKQTVKAPPPRPGAPSRQPKPLLLTSPSGKPFPAAIGPVFLAYTATTPGLADYLKHLHGPQSGSAFPFYVAALARDGERVLAGEIHLTIPSAHPPE